MSYDKDSDIEFWSGCFEEEQSALAAWHKAQVEQDEADISLYLNTKEEERKFRDRYQPWTGASLNGRHLLIDVETGDICDQNGKSLNSCDSLAVIDGCLDQED